MQKNNVSIYGLVALIIVFVSINFQHIVNFTDQLSKNSVRNIFKAAVVTSSNKNYIPVKHHVGSAETLTDFANSPTKTAIRNGDWNDPSTWGGSVPGGNDIALIPRGISVTLRNNVNVKTLGVAGSFYFDPNSNITFNVENFLTYPGSRLEITPSGSVTQTVAFKGNLNTTTDPGQFGVGLVAIDSNVNIVGRQTRNTNSKIVSIEGNKRTINVTDNISDWRVGENVIFSDTERVGNNYVPNTEIRKIVSVSGNSLTLDTPLQHNYKSSVVYAGQNVRFTSNASVKGHLLFTGNTKLEFTGVYIEKLGRTRSAPTGAATISPNGEVQSIALNQIGRYSLHAHHLEQPYHIAGNVIYNIGLDNRDDLMQRWNATLHMSYGTFENNSIVNPGEAGLGIETYLDTGVVRNNLIIGSGGGGEYGQNIQSFGIWSRSPFTNITNNRVEGWIKSFSYFIDSIGFQEFYGYAFPNISGSPLIGKSANTYTEAGEFSNNNSTAYIGFLSGNSFRRAGALWIGNTIVSIRTKDFTATHGGITATYSGQLYFDGLKLSETERDSNGGLFGFVGIQTFATITNSEIKGFTFGFLPSGISNLKNSTLDNDFDVVTVIGDQDCFCHMDRSGETVTLDSVLFLGKKHIVAGAFYPGILDLAKTGSLKGISNDLAYFMQFGADKFARLLSPDRRIVVNNYNKSGKNFLVYPSYQSPDFVIPVVNITNQDLYDGKGTHPYTTGVVGRSLGDHIVRNPVPYSKIIGLVEEEITPMRVLTYDSFFYPDDIQSNYKLIYYTNSFATKLNLSNGQTDYGGQMRFIDNVKMNAGLNKYQIKLDDGKPYTLLTVGPKGLPRVAPDPAVNVTIPIPAPPPPPPLPTSLPPANLNVNTVPVIVPDIIVNQNAGIPLSATQCPYDTNQIIPAGQTFVLSTYNPTKLSVTGGDGHYRVTPNNFILYEGVVQASVTISDTSGKSVGVQCNFNVVKAVVATPQQVNNFTGTTITSITPSSGRAHDQITLIGTGFVGVDINKIYIRNTNGSVGARVNPYSMWMSLSEPTRIDFMLQDLPPGVYGVTVLGSGGLSNSVPLTVLSSNGANSFSLFNWIMSLFQTPN